MKIVINAFSARLGGGQTYLRNLLAHLPPDGDLEVLLFVPNDLRIPNDPRLRRVEARWPTENPWTRALWERYMLPRVLRREEAHILFCPGGVVATRAPAGCRVVTMFRNMIPFDERVSRTVPWGMHRLRNWVLRRVMLRSMGLADLTIFISDHARSVIEGLASIPNPVTIPHGIPKQFRTSRAETTRPADIPPGSYVLYVSRFDVYKHHAEVVRGFAQLPASLRSNLNLLLAGETDSPEAERVRRLVSELNLNSQVHLIGSIPYGDLPAYYQHADAVVFASSCENCPNILLEAMASGRPVLSSNVMPMPEFGGPGLSYFSPFDPAELANELHRILTNTAYRESVASSALARSERYDWAKSAKQTWDEIRKLLT